MYTDVPQSTSRFIRFIYTNKATGNIGLDDVNVDIGAASAAQEINVKQGVSTIVSGDTYVINSPVATMTPTIFSIET